eukprot:g33366.t1
MRCVISQQRMVSLKGCLTLRHLAEEVPDFQNYLKRCPEALEHLAQRAKPPMLPQARSLERDDDKIYRMAADRALRAVVSGPSADKASVRARCEGFGNYMPPPEVEEAPTGVAGLVNEMVGFVGDAVADTVDDFREKGAVGADFWAFATTVPRSASLAAKESTRLRGAWITDQLAVQKVHGYSLSAVRIVCVVASSDEERQRLESFFARDQRNMRARFRVIEDALDQAGPGPGSPSRQPAPLFATAFHAEERRVLLKVPYDTSLDIIWHEYEVLQDLAGIQGIPRLYGVPFFFEDLGVNALATEFSGATSVQETLGTPVDAYRMACFLKTLQEVHAPLKAAQEVAGLLCGWSRASRGAAEELDFEQLLPWLQAAPKSVPLARLRGASVFSAPEQYVSLYTGEADGD